MSERSVVANATAINALRNERGMTIEDLAQAAGVGERTVQNACLGKRVSRFTLGQIAKALGVSFPDLLGDAIPARTVPVQIIIQGDMIAMNDHPLLREFVTLLKAVSGIVGEVNIVDVSRGSVVITLEMEAEDAARLLATMPDFQELAWGYLMETPDGEAARRGEKPSESWQKLLAMVRAVSEARVVADPVLSTNKAKPVVPQADSERIELLRMKICDYLLHEPAIAAWVRDEPISLEPVRAELEELGRLIQGTGEVG